jgi:hypothetical protein
MENGVFKTFCPHLFGTRTLFGTVCLDIQNLRQLEIADAVVKFMVSPLPDMDDVSLARPRASIVPSEQANPSFLFY